MNKIMLLVSLLLIGGCTAKHPAIANLDLIVAPQSSIYNEGSAFIQGHDGRGYEEVVSYQLQDQLPIKIPNMTDPHILATKYLASGFRQQGLMFENNSDVRILLDINELLVSITKPKFLYISEARSRLTLKVVNRGTSLTKKYEREATQESATRPDVKKAENMLNDQLSDIISQILKDEDVRTAITSR